MSSHSLISVICPSKNSGHYLATMIESVQRQTHKNYEILLIDAASTDDTLDVLKKYPKVTIHTEKDLPYIPALKKGFDLSSGKYIMQTSVSDGYRNDHWFAKCADILDNNPDISLVWGLPQTMLSDGTFTYVSYHDFFHNPPPQGPAFFDYWLRSKNWFHFPEGNFSIRKSVLKDCWPDFDIYKPFKELEKEFWLTLSLNFHKIGYIAHFEPVIANFARIHPDSCRFWEGINPLLQKWENQYYAECEALKKEIISGKRTHLFRNGFGNIILNPYSFNNRGPDQIKSIIKTSVNSVVPPIVFQAFHKAKKAAKKIRSYI